MTARFATMATCSYGYACCAAGTSVRAEDKKMDAALLAVSIFAFLRLIALVLIGP